MQNIIRSTVTNCITFADEKYNIQKLENATKDILDDLQSFKSLSMTLKILVS